MKKSIFFDLDGTLWDALIPLTESWNQAMDEHNENFHFDLKMMQSYMGLTPEETVPLAFPGVDFSKGMELFRICIKSEISYLSKHPGILYPQEEEVLSILSQEYPLYVVSNSDKGYVENYLSATHMEKYFTGHVCAGDTNLPKWKNIIYLKEKEGIDQVIYLGDTLKDKTESEKAGVQFIHASYGFGKIENCKFSISELAELPIYIQKIFD
ncbi:MAG: HAD family hydrolase [Bacilli bacterium]